MNLPFKSGAFDTVLTTQVLEHVPEPHIVFSEVARVLKQGGTMMATVPQTWGLHEEPFDYYRYTKYGLTYLAEKNGLKVETVVARGGFFAMAGQLLSVLVFESLCYKGNGHYRSIILQAPVRVICAVIQVLGFTIDKLLPNYNNTLGYGIICKK